MTFFAWADHDKHKTVVQKLAGAIAGFRDKHGHAPTLALVSHADAALLADSAWRGCDIPEVTIESADFIARGTFYLAREDEGAASMPALSRGQ